MDTDREKRVTEEQWGQRGEGWVFKCTLDLSKQDIMEHLPVPNNTVITFSRQVWVTCRDMSIAVLCMCMN